MDLGFFHGFYEKNYSLIVHFLYILGLKYSALSVSGNDQCRKTILTYEICKILL